METESSFQVNRLSEEEIKRLALDIYRDKVFLSSMIDHSKDYMTVFIPLVFGAWENLTRNGHEHLGVFYEYYDRAGPMSINGFPMFFSFKVLHREDCDLVDEAIREIKAAVENI